MILLWAGETVSCASVQVCGDRAQDFSSEPPYFCLSMSICQTAAVVILQQISHELFTVCCRHSAKQPMLSACELGTGLNAVPQFFGRPRHSVPLCGSGSYPSQSAVSTCQDLRNASSPEG